jgi:transposase-like protein
VSSYAAVAKSNSLLIGTRISPEDKQEFNNLVLERRDRYQQLCNCASKFVKKVREDQGLATPAAGSRATTPVVASFKKPTKSRTNLAEESQQLKDKQQQHLNNTHRPNIHIGLHYSEMMDQYGLPSLYNVLIGEDKHR